MWFLWLVSTLVFGVLFAVLFNKLDAQKRLTTLLLDRMDRLERSGQKPAVDMSLRASPARSTAKTATLAASAPARVAHAPEHVPEPVRAPEPVETARAEAFSPPPILPRPPINFAEQFEKALAGAGIASLYGTLCMASELYGQITPLTAFILLAMVTIAALSLSLRRGAPTAIMGMIGGFITPYLASTGSDNVAALLIYLGLLMAGLFALAIHSGWMWLALAATGGGPLWSLGLILEDVAGLAPGPWHLHRGSRHCGLARYSPLGR